LVKRPVRTRMQGVVGRAGEKPALTRFRRKRRGKVLDVVSTAIPGGAAAGNV